MKRTITLLLALAALSGTTSLTAQELQTRKARINPRHAGAEISVVSGRAGLRSDFTSPAEAKGTLKLFLKEDFSLMTAGSELAPDTVGTICAPDGTYKYRVWQNIDPQYTHWRGWGGTFDGLSFDACQGKGSTHAAGGTLHLGSKEGAKLNTPPLDLMDVNLHADDLTSDNIIVLRFRAKVTQAIDPELCKVRFFVESAETSWYRDGDNPVYTGEWSVLRQLTPSITSLSTEWQTYEVALAGAGHSTMVNMGFQVMPLSKEIAEKGDYHFDVLLDDVEIYKMKPFLSIPKVTEATDFTPDSFVAHWKPVEGADKYLVDVYYKTVDETVPPSPSGQVPMIRKEYLQDQEATTNSLKITGVDPKYAYYYNVRAVQGDKESYRSVDQAVTGVSTPELKEVSDLASDHYVASWSEVPSAGRYFYMAYHDKRVYKDSEVTLINEDFTGVKDLEGKATGWSVENPPAGSYGKAYPSDLNMPGWEMFSYAPCTDYIGFDGWQAINHGANASMQSPELDLSHGDGVVNVSVSLYGAYDLTSNQFPQAAIALFNYNEKTEKYDQVDIVYPAEETKTPTINKWQDYTVQLKNGSKRSIIALFAVKGPEYLFVDNFKVTQHFLKGESYLAPYFGEPLHEGSSITVSVPSYVQQDALYHRVRAVKPSEQGVVMSPFSQFGEIRKATAVGQLVLTEPSAKVVDGVLTIDNPNGDAVYVYDLTGQVLYSNDRADQQMTLSLPTEEAYVVRIGSQLYKVL